MVDRVLAHVHTFNDADIIDATISALQRQTRPVDGILVVDNASSDGTLDQPSVKDAAVLRHAENLGTSGAVNSGFRYALEHGYDWIWLFDADSVPEPDALEKLLDCYSSLPVETQGMTAFLACLPCNMDSGLQAHAAVFTKRGFSQLAPAADERCYPCNITIWSGCLYRTAAVSRIGLPNPDYVLDWGEFEYAYHVMKKGYKAFVNQQAKLYHNIRGAGSLVSSEMKCGPFKITVFDFPPIRCYYLARNTFYFALHDAERVQFDILWKQGVSVLLLTLKFWLRGRTHSANVRACLHGIWHGLTGNVKARY